MPGRHVDEIAEHIVELDLQCGNAGFAGIARLQFGNDAPAVIAQAARFIQGLVPAGRDEAAIPCQHWQAVIQRPHEV